MLQQPGQRFPLNKGRGITPGYTWLPGLWPSRGIIAQQRPRYHPRLHLRTARRFLKVRNAAQQRPRYHPRLHAAGWRRSYGNRSSLNKGRGITPGYTPTFPFMLLTSSSAQQRPRYHPRLHAPNRYRDLLNQSTLNKGRGITPGYTCSWFALTPSCESLNKGRGITPGYTKTLFRS